MQRRAGTTTTTSRRRWAAVAAATAGWALALGLVAGYSLRRGVGREPRAKTVAGLPPDLRSGDLVFRRGGTVLSRVVMAVDAGAPYSHVGIVAFDGIGARVVQALPPSAAVRGGVVTEPLQTFLSEVVAIDAGFYRVADASVGVAERAARVALGYAASGIPFDDDFDLTDQRKLYCTELVWAAYREVGIDLVDGHRDTLVLPTLGITQLILPGTLAASGHVVRLAPKP